MFIEISDATKTYGKNEIAVNALKSMDVSMEKGKMYAILGPSGSGKSTLLNMLGGLDSLSSGKIVVDGCDISNLSKNGLTEYRRTSVGVVFQFYNLIPDLTVKENIQAVADIAQSPFVIDELLEALDMEKFKDRFPKELSGGQQQRVAIVRALVKNPKLLLCDELTGALDTKSSKAVLGLIEKVHETYGTTIIIVTHNEGISEMVDATIRIRDGKVESVTENENKKKASELEL